MDWEESLFTWRCYIINIYTGLPFPCSLCLFWHTGKILKDKKKCRRKKSAENEKAASLFCYYTILSDTIILNWVTWLVALFLSETNYLSYGELWALFTFICDWMNSCLLQNHCPPTHKFWKTNKTPNKESEFQLSIVLNSVINFL